MSQVVFQRTNIVISLNDGFKKKSVLFFKYLTGKYFFLNIESYRFEY